MLGVKKNKKLIIILLILSMLLSSVTASERASSIISSYSGGLAVNASGDLIISFDISTHGKSDLLGASSVELWMKTLTGWETVAIYTASTNPNLQSSGKSFYGYSLSYNNAIVGEQYRAYIRLYATNGTNSDYRDVYSNPVVVL